MTVLIFSETPEYLRSSAFYCSLSNENENDEIQVPDDCFKTDDQVLDLVGFTRLLKVFMFWGLDKLPQSIVVWCCNHPLDEWGNATSDILGEESGLLAHLQYIFDPEASEARFSRAVESNQPDILEVMARDSTIDQKCLEGATKAAARLGRLNMLKILHEHRFYWAEEVCAAAAAAGHLDCLQYAVENGCDWDEGTFRAAAASGHLECLKYADANGCPWDSSASQQAATHGHAECLRFVLRAHPAINEDDYAETLKNGHIECLKVLQEYHFPWTELNIAAAANHGHLDCVKYLREECACEWDEGVTGFAAQHNHLSILQYAAENGCICNSYVLLIAAEAGSLACVQYLLNERHMAMTDELFACAFNHGRVQCVQYLLGVGCPYMNFRFCDNEESYYLNTVKVVDGYDARLLECVQLVCSRGWVVSDALCWFVDDHRSKLPLCAAYLHSIKNIKC